jgi:hypothetical protein
VVAAYATDGLLAATRCAHNLGVEDDLDTCKETMYEVAGIAALLVKHVAERSGHPIADEVALLGHEIELELDRAHGALGPDDPHEP